MTDRRKKARKFFRAKPLPGKQGKLFESAEYLEYKAERKRLGLDKTDDDKKEKDG